MAVINEKVDISLFGELKSKNVDLNQKKLRK